MMGLMRGLLAMVGPASRSSRHLGRAGERLAARYLKRHGYRVLLRNHTTRVGEADIVCCGPDGRTIVVVEVKTRARVRGDTSSPPPEASITAHKRRKLLQVARVLRSERGWEDRPLRIDVIAIDWPPSGRAEIRHFESAVTEN